ncbi:uncharacterized membrane protein YcaP (DUF421 family) [Desulfohalotomaculum tongense]|uniref:DUF421 domain-containing protein n=1 Tax=Desulforadius tongensis TaxID=1216062 RepID=UPI00195A4908|nr:YetF domain-containing protein [Desulforadius tongensis]MBM7856159.1 uncharacterized membrane protein YcaP (DUF421 family) [Desulforadius tongensis]
MTIVVATRVLRFRHVGIMARHNYLVAAGIVGVAGAGILNPANSLALGLVAIVFLTVIGISLSFLDLKLPQRIGNKPIPLISYGKMEKKQLRKVNMTIENLLGQLRLNGVFKLDNVENAYFEATGKVSVVKKAEARPVFRQQLNLGTKMACPPIQLVYDGKVIEKNLKRLALDHRWLEKELQKQGFASPRAVFFAALLENGSLYVCSH